MEEAKNLTPPELLSALGSAFEAVVRYERGADPRHLDEAASIFERIIDEPQFCVVEPGLGLATLQSTAMTYVMRYLATGRARELDRAVELLRSTLEGTPFDVASAPPHVVALCLTTLGSALYHRYAESGDQDDLDRSIAASRDAIDLAGPSSPHLAGILNNLALTQRTRYARTGELTDLDAAIEALGRAVTQTPASSPDLPGFLVNLGDCLKDRAREIERFDDLHEAVRLYEQAVQLTPPDSRHLPRYLARLGHGLLDRYRATQYLADVERSVETLQRAVALTPAGSPMLGVRTGILGEALLRRFRLTDRLSDLHDAIGSLERAVDLMAPGSPDLAGDLMLLACALEDRHARAGMPADLDSAVRFFERAASLGVGTDVTTGLESARLWGISALARKSWQEAARAHEYAREASRRLSKIQLLRGAKEISLRKTQGFAAVAGYVLAKVGNYSEAVVALEQGRVRLLGEVLGRERADLERVRQLDPAAFQLFQDAVAHLRHIEVEERDDLTSRVTRVEQLPISALGMRARQAWRDLDEATARIRHIPGYETFLNEPCFDDVAKAARSGKPLVYLITTPIGSLALVVQRRADGSETVVEPVWADSFTLNDLSTMMAVQHQGDRVVGGYLAGQLGSRHVLEAALDDVLPLLGERLVAPVAAHLRRLGTTEVVLIPSGALGLLPLHAARYWVAGRDVSFLDEFTVTYALSAKTLTASRSVLAARQSCPSFLVGVGNPLPHPKPLPFARSELQAVAATFAGESTRLLEEQMATKKDLLSYLPGATYVHLACHGVFDVDEPLDSHLQLANQERLTLREILDIGGFDDARLVVLSACQTALTDARRLPDEAIGLPGGMLQAGAAGVVATLWSVDDQSTAMLMEKFYQYHRHGDVAVGGGPLPPAEALRRAQCWLRAAKAGELLKTVEHLGQSVRRDLGDAEFQGVGRFSLNDPEARPFANSPFHWAPFVFIGA